MTIDPRSDATLQSLILQLAAEVRGCAMPTARFASIQVQANGAEVKMSYDVELSDEFGTFRASVQDFGSGVGALTIDDHRPDGSALTVYELSRDESSGQYQSQLAIDRLNSADATVDVPALPLSTPALPTPPEPESASPEAFANLGLALTRFGSISFAYARLISIRDGSELLELRHVLLGLSAHSGTHAADALHGARMLTQAGEQAHLDALPSPAAFAGPQLDDLNQQLLNDGFDRPAPPPDDAVGAFAQQALAAGALLSTGDLLRELLVFDVAYNSSSLVLTYLHASPADLWAAIDRHRRQET